MSETAIHIAIPPTEGVEQHASDGASPARRIVGVQFRRAAAMIYDFDANGLPLAHGARVVVETERGEALGWVVGVPEDREPHSTEGVLRRVIRVADGGDYDRDKHNHAVEREALRFCADRARVLKLPMKLVACEWSHSGEKAAFYFSSDDRVDFRGLVRELAQRYRVRVEMRQLKPREDAKILGAMGPCGRETCCSSWLRAFTPTSIKMAKDQGLALNPQKVTGVCGRLLCCLAYEQETYKELRKGLPRWGKIVQTPKGVGKVVDVLVLARKVRVQLDETREWEDFLPTELKPYGQPGAAEEIEPAESESEADAGDTLPTEAARPAPKAEAKPAPRAPNPTQHLQRGARPQRAPAPQPEAQKPEPQKAEPQKSEPPKSEQRPPRPERGPKPQRPERPQRPEQKAEAKSEPRPEQKQGQQQRPPKQRPPQGQQKQQPPQKQGQQQRPPRPERPNRPPQKQHQPRPAQPSAEGSVQPTEQASNPPKGEGGGRRQRHRRGGRGPGAPSGGSEGGGGSMPPQA